MNDSAVAINCVPAWPGYRRQRNRQAVAGKPYLMYKSSGKGHTIAFADDPNYRALFPSLQRLFLNAVLFGPGQ